MKANVEPLGRLAVLLLIILPFIGWPFFWHVQAAKVAASLVWMAVACLCAINRKPFRIQGYSILLLGLSILGLVSAVSTPLEVHSLTFIVKSFGFAMVTIGAIAASNLGRPAIQYIVEKVTDVFSLIWLPSLLLFVLLVANIEIPSIMLNLGDRGYKYRLFPLGLISDYTHMSLCKGLSTVRINGWSEEPGVLGTYSIYCLFATMLLPVSKKNSLKTILFHLFGTFSFSLFYFVCAWVLIPLYGVVKWVRDRALSRNDRANLIGCVLSFTVVSALTAGTFALCGEGGALYRDTPFFRLRPSESGVSIAGNNREVYDRKIFESIARFSEEDATSTKGQPGQELEAPSTRLLGYGPGSNSINGHFASWAFIVHEFGIVGLALLSMFFITACYRATRTAGMYRSKLILIVGGMLLAFYQRPEVWSPIVVFLWILIFETAKPTHEPGS